MTTANVWGSRRHLTHINRKSITEHPEWTTKSHPFYTQNDLPTTTTYLVCGDAPRLPPAHSPSLFTRCRFAMGAQQVKERGGGGGGGGAGTNHSSSTSTTAGDLRGGNVNALGAGSSLRASRIKSRTPKDGRQIGSNIFTEHSGKRPIRTYRTKSIKYVFNTSLPFDFFFVLGFSPLLLLLLFFGA